MEKRKRSRKTTRQSQQEYQEQLEDAKMASMVSKMRENHSKIIPTPITCDKDLEDYCDQLEEGISEEELNNMMNIKAGRLIKLWEIMLSELLLLEERLKSEIDLKYRVEEIHTYSPENYKHVEALINACGMIRVHQGGIRTSLENLRSSDPDKKWLAIMTSAVRGENLEIMLAEMEMGAVTVDTKDIKEVLGKIDKVVEGQIDFYLG